MKHVMILVVALLFNYAHGQAVEVTDDGKPKVGEEAAQKYFKGRSDKEAAPTKRVSSGDHYLSLQFGPFISGSTYRWGKGNKDDTGQMNIGVTYKIGEWTGSTDLAFKADITTYALEEGRATKLTLMPAVAFPEASSGFPLYFGAGAGLGIFLKQIPNESALSFDYSIFAGARFFRILNDVGFMLETGMKNHLLLLSDGQYNGVYLDFGLVFEF
jgi:hypothetical protein